MLGIFPANEPDQRLILKRFFIAAASYALWIGLGLFYHLQGDGLVPNQMVPFIIGGTVLTNVYFYVVIRLGFNKRHRDPSMTAAQIAVAMAWMLILMFTSVNGRGLLISGYIMIMMFGIFRLSRRAMLALATFAVAGYLGIIGLDYFLFHDRFNGPAEAVRLAVLTGMMAWCTLFGGHVSALRRRLRARNRELNAALDEIGKLARRDDLTNAFNRRYIMEALTHERARAERQQTPFSLCILDLDRFKTINDRYGHLTGDRVLMAFSERIRGTLRGMDLVDSVDRSRTFGRYGGEEFIVLLPDTPLAGALRCAERIRKVTEEEAFDDVFHVTVSAGVAEYRRGESIENTLRRADAALYEAKDRGRNRVVAEDNDAPEVYELAVGDTTVTNVIVGPFGQHNG